MEICYGHNRIYNNLNFKLSLIVYLLAVLVAGIYFSKKEMKGKEFFKGDGSVPWYVTSVSILPQCSVRFPSWDSLVTLMQVAGFYGLLN